MTLQNTTFVSHLKQSLIVIFFFFSFNAEAFNKSNVKMAINTCGLSKSGILFVFNSVSAEILLAKQPGNQLKTNSFHMVNLKW